MGYYDHLKNVNEYIRMANGYDGRELNKILKKYLAKDSTLLELGMGPGKDLEMLSKLFEVTGSDSSQIFIDLYKKKNKDAELILLDALTIETDKKFDCIYSNKVLHHLSKKELKQSFKRQIEVLNEHGIIFHSFWYGNKVEAHHGLKFFYYTEKDLKQLIQDDFDIQEMNKYMELEEGDSIYILSRKKNNDLI